MCGSTVANVPKWNGLAIQWGERWVGSGSGSGSGARIWNLVVEIKNKRSNSIIAPLLFIL